MLSLIAGVAEGPDSTLYVLDRDFQKIVVFNRDGSLRRILLGGYGRGPGEFVRPRGMAVSATGTVAVLDQDLNRVTLFDDSGAYKHSFVLTTGVPIQLAFADNGSLVLLEWFQRSGDPILRVFSVEGEPGGLPLRASDRDAHFSAFSEPGWLGVLPDGNVVYAHAALGLWTQIGDGPIRTRGRELFPSVRGRTVSGRGENPIRMIDVGTRGFGSLGPDTVVLVYGRWANPTVRGSRRLDFLMALLDPSGQLLDTLNMSHLLNVQITRFVPARDGHHFYLAVHEPYPHVVRVRLSAREEP